MEGKQLDFEKTHEWLTRIEPLLSNTFWTNEYKKAILIGIARTFRSHQMIEKYFVKDMFEFKKNLQSSPLHYSHP